MPGFEAERRHATLLELDLQPWRQGAGFVTDSAQPCHLRPEHRDDRVRIGRGGGLERHFPFPVNHADRGLLRRRVRQNIPRLSSVGAWSAHATPFQQRHYGGQPPRE